MHRGLELLDIVEMICEQVAQQPVFSGRNHEPAILARTTKIFLVPSLNALWRNQQTICNLLRCMPDDLWDIEEDIEEDNRHIEIRITSADWERPLFYLHRVRSLTVDTSFETLEFFEALSLSLPGDYMFPNLEELEWFPMEAYDDAGSAFHYIRFLLSPHIRKLSIGGFETIADLSILSNLAFRHPSLTHVTILYLFSRVDIPSPWEKASPVISNFVRGLMHLKSLSAPVLDDAALDHLGQLPSLTALTIASHGAVTSFLPSPAESGTFPALTKLTMPTMVGATELLPKFSGCSLIRFTILSNSLQPTNNDARHFYAALAIHCSRSSLQTIEVFEDHDNPTRLNTDEAYKYSVGEDIIEPLFSFANPSRYRFRIPSDSTWTTLRSFAWLVRGPASMIWL
ncbi:hypothetical protein DFH06DRAFT_753312 [Mycena polygramma]|nr:hypothetical protein DFH06DRAFT_753312 [Mycena polygramma]